MEDALKDERFKHIRKDPRFRRIPRNVRKIKIDKRFQTMFRDKEFNAKSRSDERGRPLNLAPSENLKKLYNVISEDEDGESSENEQENAETKIKVDKEKLSEESSYDSGPKNKFSNNNKKVDKRFQTMFRDKKFEVKSPSDEGGRPLNLAPSENLTELYNMMSDSSEDDESSEDERENENGGTETKVIKEKFSEESSDVSEDDDSDAVPSFNPESKNKFPNDKKGKVNKLRNASSSKLKRPLKSFPVEQESLSKSKATKFKTDLIEEDSDADSSEDEELTDDSSSSEESDSSESDSSVSDKEEEEFDHHWEELNEEAPNIDEITNRLAVCNMDWDRIRAEDLYTCFESFKPPNSVINCVKIYPSEFGLKRMSEEKLSGPTELVEKSFEPGEEEEEGTEDKKGSEYHREKLRKYQLNRLKYYYAVVECDEPNTANHLYEQLNGMEYESSSVRFDLRFIPDDVTFDQEPTSVVDKTPDPSQYKPRLFVTTALQLVNVNLTWDETDPKRRETLQKAFTEAENIDNDIKDYLASSSSESEFEEEVVEESTDNKTSLKDRITKYKSLLQSLEENEKKPEEEYEMEITWEPGLKEKTEEKVKEKLQHKTTQNPFEQLIQDRKEYRKTKKKGKKNATNEKDDENNSSNEDSDSDFGEDKLEKKANENKKLDELYLMSDSRKLDVANDKSFKKKNKSKKMSTDDGFKCNVSDPRFSALYTAPEYNIDPSDSHFKQTEGTRAIINEKQRRLENKQFPFRDNTSRKKRKYH